MMSDAENLCRKADNDPPVFYEQPRGLIAVWGNESVQFMDGMITNNVKALTDGDQMLAAFPNAQGRLLAAVRIRRIGDSYLIETEEATRAKLFQNLFRFTFAGDFFAEDRSDAYSYFELFGTDNSLAAMREGFPRIISFDLATYVECFVPKEEAEAFREFLTLSLNITAIGDSEYEPLRIEHGISKFGVDIDETTIVPEIGVDGLISYNKGCYVGQEIIARIHFRGHVAKQLTGLTFSGDQGADGDGALLAGDGRNAGRITSKTYSPKLEKYIGLGLVRYDFLAAGTELRSGSEIAVVTKLPFKS